MAKFDLSVEWAKRILRGMFRSALGGFLLLFLNGCVTGLPTESALQRFEFEEPQMGVPFRIVTPSDFARSVFIP